MPIAPKRPCPRCGKLIDSTPCACGFGEKRDLDQRKSASKRGYDRKWRKTREEVLRNEPLCRFCLEDGRVTPATEVDHIKPISQGGARFDHANLRALCKSCHSRHTAKNGGGFGNSRP